MKALFFAFACSDLPRGDRPETLRNCASTQWIGNVRA